MNWLDLIIVILAAIGLMKGLFDGLVRQVISIVSFLVATICAKFLADPLRDFILTNFSVETVSPLVVTAFCYLAAFIIILFLLSRLGRIIHKLINATPLSLLNFFAGGILGMLLVLLIMSLSFNVLSFFDSHHTIISKQSRNESVLYNKVESIIPFLYPVLDNYLKCRPEPVVPVTPVDERKSYPSQIFV